MEIELGLGNKTGKVLPSENLHFKGGTQMINMEPGINDVSDGSKGHGGKESRVGHEMCQADMGCIL